MAFCGDFIKSLQPSIKILLYYIMASIAKRVLARALGALRGGAATGNGSNPSSPSPPPSSALGAALEGAVETLKNVENGQEVASKIVEQAGKAIEKQEEVANKASEKADDTLVKASERSDSNTGTPVIKKTPQQIKAEAAAAGEADAMKELAEQQAAAERAAANAELKQASNNAERVRQEAKAKFLAAAATAAAAKEQELVKARVAEDTKKATERLSEVAMGITNITTYLKSADLNAETNENKNATAKNVSGKNLDETKEFLKSNIAKYESEVKDLKTVESVEKKIAEYTKKSDEASNKQTQLIMELTGGSNAAKKNQATINKAQRNLVKNKSDLDRIAGQLLAANMAEFVLTTAINRAEERKTELVNAARAENLRAAAAAAGGAAASVVGTVASGIGSFLATLRNPTRAAEVATGLAALVVTYYTNPDYLYGAAILAGATVVNVAATAYFKTDPLIATLVKGAASTVGALAGGIFSGLFSKNPEEVKEAKMKLRSADAKVKKEVAAVEKATVQKANSSPDVPEGAAGCKDKPCMALNVDGTACKGFKGMKLLANKCVCFTHFNMGDAVKWQKGGTRRRSSRGLRQTRKYRF